MSGVCPRRPWAGVSGTGLRHILAAGAPASAPRPLLSFGVGPRSLLTAV